MTGGGGNQVPNTDFVVCQMRARIKRLTMSIMRVKLLHKTFIELILSNS